MGCKWVFKVNRRHMGQSRSIKQNSGKRLTEIYGINYQEMFAPIVKINIVQFVTAHFDCQTTI